MHDSFLLISKMSKIKNTVLIQIRKNGIQVLLLLSIFVTLASFILTKVGEKDIQYGQERIIHTYTVIQYTDQLTSLLKDAETSQRGYLLTMDEKYLEPYQNAKSNIASTQKLLEERVAQTPVQAERATRLRQLTSLRLEDLETTLSVYRNQGQQAAIEMVGTDKGKAIMDNILELFHEFNNQQLSLLETRNQDLAASIFFTSVTQWTSNIFLVFILILAISTINKERKARQKLFSDLDENNKLLLFNDGQTLMKQDETKAVNNLISSLKSATQFIKEIGNHQYNTSFTGITSENQNLNQENLSGELIRMRNQLVKVAEEERRRNWTTNGIAEFAEVLRNERNNLSELSETIVTRLVKYTSANQGGLFILNEEDSENPYLELLAAYAYNRKKFLQKKIQPGEGLVGQAFLEQDIIFLTDVPQNYVTITSGLGDANPRCLLIIPLKLNQEVLGVIELASFKVFEPYQIEFIQKVAESIASTITSVKTNEVTKRLLLNAQEMTEEMKAQEEEMRQNMEELSATQEELQRKEFEYIKRIEELESQQQNI